MTLTNEQDHLFSTLKEITPAELALCAAVVYLAVSEARIDPFKYNGTYRRYMAVVKKDAIDFILSERFNIWVDYGGLDINVDWVRAQIAKEDREGLVALIQSTMKGYPEKRKKKANICVTKDLENIQ